MPLGPRPPRYSPGQRSISARSLNASSELLHRLSQIRGGPGTVWSPAGPQIRGQGLLYRLGTTPSSGIPGQDTNGINAVDVSDASLVVAPGNPYLATLQSWPSTFIAFNLSSQAVGGNALVICQRIWGLWLVIWEDCAGG